MENICPICYEFESDDHFEGNLDHISSVSSSNSQLSLSENAQIVDNSNNFTPKMIKLNCSHYIHFHCLTKWFHTEKYRQLICPYCKSSVDLNIPHGYDAFSLFYFWTKFKRNKCVVTNCNNKEYPLNFGKCARHFYPYIQHDDLFLLMSILFPYYFLQLSIKKKIIFFILNMYKKGVTFQESFLILLKNNLFDTQYIYLDNDKNTVVNYNVIKNKIDILFIDYDMIYNGSIDFDITQSKDCLN